MNENLGYNHFFEAGRNKLKLNGFPVARIISEARGTYKAKNEDGEYFAKITGKQMFQALSRENYPAVGDWVAIKKLEDNRAVIQEILPRQTMLKRKYGDKNKAGGKDKIQVIATNIDTAFIVQSIDRDYSPNRFERYFSIAEDGGVKPTIIMNKIDLLQKKELLDEKLSQLKSRFPNVDIILTNTKNKDGLDKLKEYIEKDKTYCFLGSSGVGKSSLINRLLEKNTIKTGSISSYSNRGKHVTTSRQMYFLENGGIVIDNPGIREVDITDSNPGVNTVFDEISALAQKCKYTNCAHIHEPGCEVINALESGKLSKEKYTNYLTLKKEARYQEMNNLKKREKNRQFGKLIKKTMKELKRVGRKD